MDQDLNIRMIGPFSIGRTKSTGVCQRTGMRCVSCKRRFRFGEILVEWPNPASAVSGWACEKCDRKRDERLAFEALALKVDEARRRNRNEADRNRIVAFLLEQARMTLKEFDLRVAKSVGRERI